MKTKKTFRDLYKFPGFRARTTLKQHPEDTEGYIVTLERRQKKPLVPAAAQLHQGIVTGELILYETWMPEQTRIYLEFEYRRVACPHCKAVKRETLSMLASRPALPSGSKTALDNSAVR